VNFPLWTVCCRYSLGVNMKFPVWPQWGRGGGGLANSTKNQLHSSILRTRNWHAKWRPRNLFGKTFCWVGGGWGWGRDRFGSIAKICQAGGPPYCDTVTLKFARYSTITITRKHCHRTLLYFITQCLKYVFCSAHRFKCL
jgi:hypothetical protein